VVGDPPCAAAMALKQRINISALTNRAILNIRKPKKENKMMALADFTPASKESIGPTQMRL